MTTYIVIWIICGIITGAIASGKGKGFGGWFIVGVILGPIGVLIALLSGKSGKICPACKKSIDENAIICPYCQTNIKEANEMLLKQSNESIQQILNSDLDKYKKIRALADMRDKKLITEEQFQELKEQCENNNK